MTVCSLDPPAEEESGNQKKASIETLEQSYKELNSRKIKDSLSSFLPDVPGHYMHTQLDLVAWPIIKYSRNLLDSQQGLIMQTMKLCELHTIAV